MHKLMALGLSAIFAVFCAAASASAAGQRVDIPIGQLTLPNGDIRYFVPVRVNGGLPIDAELDTGSFGLRVLNGALSKDQFRPTDVRRRYGFSGGARFNGFLATAPVSIGDVQTEQPIMFQVIESVDCLDQKPNCPASRVKPEDYRIAGDGFAGQGFNAIIGISMRAAMISDFAPNPLTSMGDGRWIVVLPRPGTASGHLIINPTPDERATFTTMRLSRLGQGWADGALPGCLVDEQARTKDCGKTLLDSGGPGFFVDSSRVSSATEAGAGRQMRLEVGGSRPVMTVSFTSGSDFSSRVILRPPSGTARISAGNVPFFSYAVLYDARAGTIGFRARSGDE